MFLSRISFIIFCFDAKTSGFCLRAQAVNSDFMLDRLATVKFEFCLLVDAFAKCTKCKFSIPHLAMTPPFIAHSGRARIFT